MNLVIHKPILELVNELRPIVPSSLDGFFFSNSGAEAVEGALKLAGHAHLPGELPIIGRDEPLPVRVLR